MVRVLWAVREASRNSRVRIDELFDLDPDHESNWEDLRSSGYGAFFPR
jgi:hypothetical protein